MKTEFIPKSMTFDELSEWYLPTNPSAELRRTAFMNLLLENSIPVLLGSPNLGRRIKSNKTFSLTEVWVIVRHLGWPPYKLGR